MYTLNEYKLNMFTVNKNITHTFFNTLIHYAHALVTKCTKQIILYHSWRGLMLIELTIPLHFYTSLLSTTYVTPVLC